MVRGEGCGQGRSEHGSWLLTISGANEVYRLLSFLTMVLMMSAYL